MIRNTVVAIAAAAMMSSALWGAVPRAGHVVMVLEENHGYSSVIGSSSMPYLNYLANKYGLATRYYATNHPSIGNYFNLSTGQTITNNDSFNSEVTADNLVRHLMAAGRTWKSYAESMPYTGYTGWDTNGYVKHHNPFAYFSDVAGSTNEKDNLVPFPHFAQDLANGQLPDFSFVIPNIYHDAHNGSLSAADYWLKTKIGPLLASSTFQKDGLLIIVFDEASDSDTSYGGGHVAMVMVGPKVRLAHKSTYTYTHRNLLRTVLDALGVSSYPGAASSVSDMSDMFVSSTSTTSTTASSTTGSVTLYSPAQGATLGSPVHVKASATCSSYRITGMWVYVDHVGVYNTSSSSLDTYRSMSSGTHTVQVKAWNSQGTIFQKSVSITVK